MSRSRLIDKSRVHKFIDSLGVELEHARRLDSWFGEHYTWRPATMDEQWPGIHDDNDEAIDCSR